MTNVNYMFKRVFSLAILFSFFLLSDISAVLLKATFVFMILTGALELYSPFLKSKRLHSDFFAFVIAVYLLISMGLYLYANLLTDYLKYSIAVIAVFDIAYNMAKGKVVGLGAFATGALSAFLASLFLRDIPDLGIGTSIYHSAVTVTFAYIGYCLAQYFRDVYELDGFNFIRKDQIGLLDLSAGFIAGAFGFLISVIFLRAVFI